MATFDLDAVIAALTTKALTKSAAKQEFWLAKQLNKLEKKMAKFEAKAALGKQAVLKVGDTVVATNAKGNIDAAVVFNYDGVAYNPLTSDTLASDLIDAGTPPVPGAQGKTFVLASGADNIVGTSGDDTVMGYVNHDAAGGTTLSTADFIDGGAGTDTLFVIIDDDFTNTLYLNMANVEVLKVRDFDGESFYLNNVTGLQKVVWDGSTQWTDFYGLKNVVDAELIKPIDSGEGIGLYYGPEITSAKTLTQKVLLDSTEYNSSSQSLDAYAYDGDGSYFGTYDITSQGAKNSLYLYTDSNTTTLNIAGAAALDLDISTHTGIKTVSAGTMTGALELDVTNSAASLAVTTGSGADEITVTGSKVASVSMGAGNDTLAVNTDALAATATIDLGAGDDTITLGATPTAGVTISGGAGSDTIAIAAVGYSAISGWTDANRAKISGFETLSISDALANASSTDISKLAGITNFKTVGVATGGTATVTKIGSGSTVTLDGALHTNDGILVVDVTGAADSTTDVLNVSIKGTNNATIALTVAEVETLNIATSAATGVDYTYTTDLVATKAKVINFTGTEAVSFTADSTDTAALTTVNASALEAGATIDVSAVSGVTVTGTTKADTITVGELDQVSGNGGDDTFVITAPSTGLLYSTIKDANKGDILQFDDQGTEVFNTTKVVLAGNAVFQDYLNKAAEGDGSTHGVISWFQFGGNTYVVQDLSNATSFDNSTDLVIELTGLIDLSTATGAGTNVITLA